MACGEVERPRDQLSSVTKAGSAVFTANSSVPAISSPSLYWPNRVDTVSESLGSVINKDFGEKRKQNGAGCRLFGIQLFDHSNLDENSARVGDDQPVPSLEAESDRSNVNRSDLPSLSCDPDKSSQKSLLDSQSKQNRTCTKVMYFFYVL